MATHVLQWVNSAFSLLSLLWLNPFAMRPNIDFASSHSAQSAPLFVRHVSDKSRACPVQTGNCTNCTKHLAVRASPLTAFCILYFFCFVNITEIKKEKPPSVTLYESPREFCSPENKDGPAKVYGRLSYLFRCQRISERGVSLASVASLWTSAVKPQSVASMRARYNMCINAVPPGAVRDGAGAEVRRPFVLAEKTQAPRLWNIK